MKGAGNRVSFNRFKRECKVQKEYFQKKFIAAAVSGALTVIALQAHAQQADSQQTTVLQNSTATTTTVTTSKDGIAEVLVTATRHVTPLLQTPVAVSAVSQEELTRDGITDVRGLSGEIPDLQIGTSAQGDSGVQISIRGVSNNDFTEVGNPAVGLHINGLYSPRPQGALALMFDLDQVEVLRGPQGTLFGRNSTGGSINIIAAKPQFNNHDGLYEQEFGDFNHLQETLVQNIPVSDQLALRLTAMKTKRDSYINETQDFYTVNMPALGYPATSVPTVDQRHNTPVDPANAYGAKNEWAARLSALLKINNEWSTLFSFENFQNNDPGDIALKDCQQAAHTPFACTGGQFTVAANVPGITDMQIQTWRSDTTWRPDDHNEFEYNISRAVEKRRQQQDSDSGYEPLQWQVTATPGNPVGQGPVNDNQTYTLSSRYGSTVQEFQWRQNFENLRTVVGLFDMEERNTIDFGQDFLSGLWPFSNYYHQPDRASDSRAIFAQSDWKVAPKWTLTTGVRYSYDFRQDTGGEYYTDYNNQYFNGITNPPSPGSPGFNIFNSSSYLPGMGAYYGSSAYSSPATLSNHSASWDKVTWRLGMAYQASPNDMVYASVSTGYKAGGFNDMTNLCGTAVDAQGQPYNCLNGPPGPQWSFLPYKPETVTNYEFGYKGKMLDNHLQLSAALFFEQYKDMQVTGQHTVGQSDQPCPSSNPTCNAVIDWYSTANVASAKISGIELEGKYIPWAGGKIQYSFSYLNAVIGSYPTYSDDQGCTTRQMLGVAQCAPFYTGSNPALAELRPYNVVGNHLPYAPETTDGISFSQNIEFDNGYALVPWISLRYQSKEFFSLRNLQASTMSDEQRGYSTVDATLRLNAPEDKWHVEAFIKNAFNTLSKNWAGYGGPNQSFTVATYNDPRMFGVRLGVEW